LSGTPVTTAWHIIKLQTKGTDSIRIAANMLNKQMQTANKRGHSKVMRRGGNNLSPDPDGFLNTNKAINGD
jgi:hypothetical protein